MTENTVVYHQNCADGFTAAWVARKALGEHIEFVPAKYGDDAPAVKGTNVYILDFSYPSHVLLNMAEFNHMIVLDHHKTAQANCEGIDFCTFDMERSGAGLAWDHFFPDKPRPALVDYVEDRDLWRFALPMSREIHAWIASWPKTFEVWDTLADTLQKNWHQAVMSGADILRFERQKVEEMCQHVRFVDLGDGEIPVVNCSYNFGSLVGEALTLKYPLAPYAAYYFDRSDGKQQWGLRSVDFDVSEVAKRFGGGGHKHAAGYVQ